MHGVNPKLVSTSHRIGRVLLAALVLASTASAALAAQPQPTTIEPDTQPESVPATPTPQPPDAQPDSPTPGNAAPPTLPPLVMGDAAPRIAPEKWINGAPIEAFEPGRVYLVEFWATWCEPCRDSIPLLVRLQKRYKDALTVVGVSVWEKTTREFSLPDDIFIDRVRRFVDDRREAMAFTVAYDGVEGEMASTWMAAARRVSIPSVFIVDQAGRIAWIGNPHQPPGEMESVLGQVIDKTWDIAQGAEALRLREETTRKGNALAKKFTQAMEKHDFREVERLTDEMITLDAARFGQVAAVNLEILLTQTRETDKAYAFARRVSAGPLASNPNALNDMAWTIVTAHGVERRDTDLALSLARTACDLSLHQDGRILDTLARVHAERGEFKEAYEAATQAVAQLPADTPETTREEISSRQEQYRVRAGVGPR
ncbi:MAG: redoxin family protein [Phycisphaerales bacterium]|nr:redoxin family protein [Phycisphaerales bacterium]